MALRLYRKSLEGVSVFVTLEPCSFQGRTPSCALTLIEKGAKELFVAVVDPHPKNRGNGIRLLREAGVDVETGILKDRVMSFLGQYLINS